MVTLNERYVLPREYVIVTHILWLLTSMINILGSVLGFLFTSLIVQAFAYGIWKVFGCISLFYLAYIIYLVRKKLINIVQARSLLGNNKESSYTLTGIQKTTMLVICVLLLAMFLFSNVIYDLVWGFTLIEGINKITDQYIEERTVIIICVYLPLWSCFHIFMLAYTWIKKSKTQHLVNNSE